jgi:hypothetical protein
MILFWVVKIEIISKMGRTIRSLGTSALVNEKWTSYHAAVPGAYYS